MMVPFYHYVVVETQHTMLRRLFMATVPVVGLQNQTLWFSDKSFVMLNSNTIFSAPDRPTVFGPLEPGAPFYLDTDLLLLEPLENVRHVTAVAESGSGEYAIQQVYPRP